MKKSDINKRILSEIDDYNTNDKMKCFLEEIIKAELYDEVGYKFIEEYKKKIEKTNFDLNDNKKNRN